MNHPRCKKCRTDLLWIGYGSMGSSHSNYYKCPSCGGLALISDRELDSIVFFNVELPKKPRGNPDLQEGKILHKKYQVYAHVWNKYPHDICLKVLKEMCGECDSGHEMGFCIHQAECTKDWMEEHGWLLEKRSEQQ